MVKNIKKTPDIPPDDYKDDEIPIPDSISENQDVKNQNLNMGDVSKDSRVNRDVFENRRKMAWLSLKSIIAMTVVLFSFLCIVLLLFIVFPDKMNALTENYKVYLEWSGSFIGWAFMAFSTIILAYMGVSAYYHGVQKK